MCVQGRSSKSDVECILPVCTNATTTINWRTPTEVLPVIPIHSPGIISRARRLCESTSLKCNNQLDNWNRMGYYDWAKRRQTWLEMTISGFSLNKNNSEKSKWKSNMEGPVKSEQVVPLPSDHSPRIALSVWADKHHPSHFIHAYYDTIKIHPGYFLDFCRSLGSWI